MKVTAKLNGVKQTVDIPVCYEELTYRQLIDLAKVDKNNILAYFFNISPETMRKAKINGIEEVERLLKFLEVAPNAEKIPYSILGFPLPKKLEFESVGQYEDIKDIISKADSDDPMALMQKYPLIVATYAMRKYDALKVDDFSEQFFNAPCLEVLAVGNFTLSRFAPSKPTTKRIAHQVGTLMTRLKQAIKRWPRNLVSSVLYYSWKRRRATSGRS